MFVFSPPSKDLIISFAGLFQSASIVYELAHSDHYHITALTMTTRSLLITEPKSGIDIFGSIGGIQHGLDTVIAVLGGQPDQVNREIFQYAISMHQLQRELRQSNSTLDIISKKLTELKQQFQAFIQNPDDLKSEESLQQELATLYIRSLSELPPKIMIHGNRGRMENPLTVNRIRSALFGGVRSAFMWHQAGGRRWHLLWQRKQYILASKLLTNQTIK